MTITTRQEFDLRIHALFDPKHPDALSLFTFILRSLRQFRLSKSYEVRDILVEVYVRGLKFVEAGGTIENPLAWIRSTAYNVIRELRREMDRIGYKNLDEEPCSRPDPLSEAMMANDLRAMRIAFLRLDADDRNLLHLRVVNQLSWRDVGKCLVATEGTNYSDSSLRQRGFRALKRLRELYEEEREAISLDSNAD
jgi:DNA-directed RNA polymerase specialized sigma24 family protein